MLKYRNVVLVVALAACEKQQEPSVAEAKVEAAPIKAGIGKVDATQGEAFVLHGSEKAPALAGLVLNAGDRLETGAIGKIQATLNDSSVVAIGANTQLKLRELNLVGGARTGSMEIVVGKFWLHVAKWVQSGNSKYDIETPNAVAGVRGTTLWGDTQVDAICALEGSIEVKSKKDNALAPAALSAGNCAAQLSQGKLTPLAPTAAQVQAYLNEVLIKSP